MDTRPLTKSQIFSVLWMVLIGFLLTGPRNFTVSTEISFLLVGATIFSLIVLGRRFPMFGYCTIVIFVGLLSALTGSRGRR
jgi:hypothetical protein